MNTKQILTILVTIIISASAGYWGAMQSKGDQTGTQSKEGERKPMFYRSPMNPSVTSPVPTKDAMGMDYVAVYADDNASSGPIGTVKIDPATTQSIGVKTTAVKKITLSSNVQAVGRVTYDEESMIRIHPKTEGWVEEMFVSKTGALVQKGDMLLSVYSPQLVTGQQEYILAVKSVKKLRKLKGTQFNELYENAKELAVASRQRLELQDVPKHQIRELQKTLKIKKSLHIHSPANGVAIKIKAREGQYITPQHEIFMMADLSKVWVIAEVYENDLPWIKEGNHVELALAGLPGRIFKGKLIYIYPYAQAKTRTIQVRMEFENKDLSLKPEMFANVTIFSDKAQDSIVVPAQAVIRTGEREQVFIAKGEGKFEPREVTVGLTVAGETQILKGLKEGEMVVTSAMFMIDSESKLREATAKMQAAKKLKPAPMDPNMKMPVEPKKKHDMGNMEPKKSMESMEGHKMTPDPEMKNMDHNGSQMEGM